jgi:hypothetical protein
MAKGLLKSTVIAAVFGFVAALTLELVTVARFASRYHAHTSVSMDFGRLTRSPILLSVFALVFAATFAYCFWLFRRSRQLPLPMLAAVFAFVLVWGTAALFISSISREPQPVPFPLVSIIVFFSSVIAMFGFYGGALGGGWLRLRLRHIHSTGRLIAESAIPGIVLGALFPVLLFIIPGDYTARSATTSTPLESVIPVVIFAVAGCLISMAFGYSFRRRLVTSSSV